LIELLPQFTTKIFIRTFLLENLPDKIPPNGRDNNQRLCA
jgi:hypothetical protein